MPDHDKKTKLEPTCDGCGAQFLEDPTIDAQDNSLCGLCFLTALSDHQAERILALENGLRKTQAVLETIAKETYPVGGQPTRRQLNQIILEASHALTSIRSLLSKEGEE